VTGWLNQKKPEDVARETNRGQKKKNQRKEVRPIRGNRLGAKRRSRKIKKGRGVRLEGEAKVQNPMLAAGRTVLLGGGQASAL